jgi:hypothetical protein
MLIEGDEAAAEVINSGHGALHRLWQRRWCYKPRRRPIASVEGCRVNLQQLFSR